MLMIWPDRASHSLGDKIWYHLDMSIHSVLLTFASTHLHVPRQDDQLDFVLLDELHELILLPGLCLSLCGIDRKMVEWNVV